MKCLSKINSLVFNCFIEFIKVLLLRTLPDWIWSSWPPLFLHKNMEKNKRYYIL